MLAVSDFNQIAQHLRARLWPRLPRSLARGTKCSVDCLGVSGLARVSRFSRFSRSSVQTIDVEGNKILEKYSQIVPRIFAQVVGNQLFIRDRRESSAGIRVRSSTGPSYACAYEQTRGGTRAV